MQDRANVGKTEKGYRLVVLRAARGLEQKDLAQRARVDQSAVCEIEQGRRDAGLEIWERLLEALLCTESGMQRAGWLIQGAFLETGEPARRAEAAAGRVIEGLGLVLEDQLRARIARRGALVPAEPGVAFQHWEALRSFSAEDLRRMIEDSAALQTLAFFEALCGESVKRARRDPQSAAALAELAVDMAA